MLILPGRLELELAAKEDNMHIILVFQKLAYFCSTFYAGKPADAAKKRRRTTRDFIENTASDQRRLWIMYICAGLFIVGTAAFSISSILGTREMKGLDADQPSVSAPAEPTPEETNQKKSALSVPKTHIQKMTSAWTGAEAEAAIEPAPFTTSTTNMKSRLITRPEITPLTGEIEALLMMFQGACENEDKEALVALIDDQDQDFHSRYIRTAERLFRRFNGIDVSFSDIEVTPLNEDEILVNLHVRVEGEFSITGKWMVLKNSDQSFTLRKPNGSNWRLCSIN
ncbi:MAG: hypothetical protein C4520_06180 [Candidatus Abyssobacteria bacterium SURF_5]|uniref:DUF4440 domain-containing protein n=1 Tax=Abyssobacteria bacterium (strain SURF_5) TaxID=2093360 RepID=A0A3A4NSJ5_ABYX5|nr:MAG: hypothetical protein C4520_06180 [Candidatus Abyssubacteria bacterium SURF_5]